MKSFFYMACIALATSSLFASEAQFQPRAKGNGAPPARVPDGVKAHRDLAYVENGHARQKLDLYVPEKAGAPLPLIIWVHGGGWAAGSKDGCPPLRQGFIERGYALASIGYRLSGDAIFPAQIEDCKAAIRWLRAHAKQYGLNPDRFGVWGSSAGGHLVALLGTSGGVKVFDVGAHPDVSSRVQAVCDFYGPTDLLQMDAHALPEARLKHDPASSPESRLIGGAIQENKEKTARANPIVYASKDDPPFLIVHGDKDPTVPIHQSQLLFDALKKAGASVHFHTIKGAGHGQGFAGREIDEMVAGFFDRCLKGTAAPTAEARQAESAASAMPQAGAGTPQRGPRLTWEQVRAREGLADDGRVHRDKFKGPPPTFDRLDRNRDGVLTKKDFNDTSPAPAPPVPPSESSVKSLRLDGERWTCEAGGQSFSGILLKPDGNGPFPAVLISHGLGGSAESFGLNKAREMVKWGLVCIAPNYTHNVRGSARGGGQRGEHPPDYGASEENIRRARACVEILRGLPYVDGKRIAAYGHSMGGFVTIGLAATAPDLLKAAAITGSGVAPRAGHPAPAAELAVKIRAPFLILHGGSDPVVRPEQSASLKEALDRNRVPNERRVFDGEGHAIDQSKREEVLGALRDWFRRHGVLP
ncbi:MAG: alpha/beta hydrolase [Verrucomicrobia bacterium]|nr:alpha/beta hydrolase [Verrucomicrobiota bacterium]